MKRRILIGFIFLLFINNDIHAEVSANVKSNNNNDDIGTRILYATDGYYRQDLFRRVADDDTETGYAVLLNTPSNLTNRAIDTLSSRPSVNCYIRKINPGRYRILFRLKIAEIPDQPGKILSWDVNTKSSGTLATGIIETSAFKQPLVYQDIEITVSVLRSMEWIEPRLFWNGGSAVWVDTISILSDRSAAPVFSHAGYTTEIERLASSSEPRVADIRIPSFRDVTRDMYRETAGIFFEEFKHTIDYWLKQPQPYPNMSEYVEHIKWLAYMYHLTGDRTYARSAVDSIRQAHRLLLQPQKQDQNTEPGWQEVVPLFFIDKWLDDCDFYTFRHRAWIRNIALRAVPSFPDTLVEYGAFNRAFLGAITGEALLALVPSAPDAAKWRNYKERVWDYWWNFRDTDESSEHYNALWFRYLLQWVEMRGFEEQFWSDPRIKQLFERYLYQVFPMGSLPHYSDSPGWNVAWGHWVYLFEACATHYKDGRFKWAAHRIYDYSVNRIENIASWSYTGREAGWSLMKAYSAADDIIPEKPRDLDVALLMRHKIVQRSEAERKETNQFFDLMPSMAPDKLVFYGGSQRNALSMMVDVVGSASHGHARPPAIVSLADRQSVLLMSLGYTDLLPEHHNIPTLADYDGFPYDNTPYHIKSENNVVRKASAVDLGAIGYGRVYVNNFEGYPASLIRDIVFIKNTGVLLKDTLISSVALRARWSPGFRVRNVGPEFGVNWTDTYLGDWVPVRGLKQNASVLARWRNPPRDLMIYFLPDPAGKLELVDDREFDQTVPLPLRVQYTLRQNIGPYTPLSSVALLLPHGPETATGLAKDVRVLLNTPDQTVVEFRDDDGNTNLVILNPSGRSLQVDDLATDAQVAYIRHRGNIIISVSMSKEASLKFAGTELAQSAPPPVSNIVPEP